MNKISLDLSISNGAALLARAKREAPSINVFGFGSPKGGTDIDESDFLHMIELCGSWIAKQSITKTIRWHSYAYKCYVEQDLGTYVTNGAMIAAAIGMGVRWQRDGENAFLGISLRRLRRKKRND